MRLEINTTIIVLKGHSGRKLFCFVFFQKILTDLKTVFTKFDLFPTFRSQNVTIYISPLETLFPLKNFARGSQLKTTFKKLFYVCNSQKLFSAVFCQNEVKGQK